MMEQKDLRRTLSPPSGRDFSSNDYFCLSRDPRIIRALCDAAETHGYGSTSSRFIRGEREIYSSLENNLARFKKCEKALIFQSGYAANLGVLSTLIRQGDVVFSDRFNHASIIDGLTLSGAKVVIFDHLNLSQLNYLIENHSTAGNRFLVSESLYSMDGDVAPLDQYASLCRKNDIHLVVDESHAVGLYGASGSGLIEHFGIGDEVLCSINGLGKAFGCLGAFVSGSSIVIEYILQRARTLMYSTALPPLALAAIHQALEIIENGDSMRAALFANVDVLEEYLSTTSKFVSRSISSPILPLIVKDSSKALNIAQKLNQAGFDVRAIRPPTVPINSARLRITSNIQHSEQELNQFINTLGKLL